jgi:hypothetical protein
VTPRNGYGFHTDRAEGVGACENYAAGRFDPSAYEAICALVPRIAGKESLDREARWDGDRAQDPGLGANINWDQITDAELKRDTCVP